MFRIFSLFLILAFVQVGCVESSTATSKPTKPDSPGDQKKQTQAHDTNIIVTCDWLQDKLKETDPSLRILDLALRNTNYESGHIPGAVFVDWRSEIIDENNKERYSLPSQQAMEKLLSKLGVDKNTKVILADNSKNRMAVRMYFTLKYFGHDQVRVLDGGTTAWEKSGKKLTKETPNVETTEYKVDKVRQSYVAKINAVRDAVEKNSKKIIDGRPTEQYTGEKPGKVFHTGKAHKRRGHVPGATSIPWASNFNEDSTFKSLDELRELYRKHGLDADSEVITYCNEGLHAAVPWFVLTELLGNSQTIVYDDSMSEWANRDDTPMKEGAEK